MLQTLDKTQQATKFTHSAEIIGSYAGIDSSSWTLCLIKDIDEPNVTTAIEALSLCSNPPNPFFGTAILKAARHLEIRHELQYLCLIEHVGDEEHLKMFSPVTIERIGFTRKKVIRSWTHDFAPLGLPLICGEGMKQIVPAFYECILVAKTKDINALVFKLVTKEAPFISSIYKSKTLADRLLLAERITRAGLKSVPNSDYISTYFSGKRKQRHRKAMRELSAFGEVSFETFSSPENIRDNLKHFFHLEAEGWKGRNKTALSDRPTTRAFCEEAVGQMSEQDQCTIHAMLLNGKTIASLITFELDGHHYPWKICFDEGYAKYSVGNLLATYATTQMTQKPNFKNLDSLAAEYNETTRRLWPEEKEFFTIVIGLGKQASKNALALTRELNRIIRIKRILISLLKR